MLTLVYDDDCGFCKKVSIYLASAKPEVLTSVGSYDDFLLATQITPKDVRVQAYLFDGLKIVDVGPGAIINSFVAVSSSVWKFLLIFNYPPLRWLANLGYGFIARIRPLLSKSCSMG